MKALSIVFMGSPDFALPSLEKIHQSGHHISAVVSNPDKRRRRGKKPEPTPVKKRAGQLGLKTIDAEDLKSEEFHEQISDLKPDLIVVVAFRILPKKILEIPEIGSVNLHASLLPKYRGAAPIHWAVIRGEKETGCTIFFLDEKVDTGEVLDQVTVPIGVDETTGELYEKLKVTGAELLLSSVNRIASGRFKTSPQNDKQATPAPKLYRENTKIDFGESAEAVHNLIRGLSPIPGAWCNYGDQKMNIYRSKAEPGMELPAGMMKLKKNRLFVGCGEGSVELKEIQLPGTKRMSGLEFANGYDIHMKLS